MGFVDLSSLLANFTFDFAGIDGITRGIYAIVETSTYDQDEASLKILELFIPIKKKIGGYTGNFVDHRIFCWQIATQLYPLSRLFLILGVVKMNILR